jgi:hypothetical protein
MMAERYEVPGQLACSQLNATHNQSVFLRKEADLGRFAIKPGKPCSAWINGWSWLKLAESLTKRWSRLWEKTVNG